MSQGHLVNFLKILLLVVLAPKEVCFYTFPCLKLEGERWAPPSAPPGSKTSPPLTPKRQAALPWHSAGSCLAAIGVLISDFFHKQSDWSKCLIWFKTTNSSINPADVHFFSFPDATPPVLVCLPFPLLPNNIGKWAHLVVILHVGLSVCRVRFLSSPSFLVDVSVRGWKWRQGATCRLIFTKFQLMCLRKSKVCNENNKFKHFSLWSVGGGRAVIIFHTRTCSCSIPQVWISTNK